MASRRPMYPTIPHTSSSPHALLVASRGAASRFTLSAVSSSAVDDAAELAFRQPRRREPALPQFCLDQRPDLLVLSLPLAEFGVPPADELLDGLVEVARYVGDDADRGGLRQARRGRQVTGEILREGFRHAYFLLGHRAVRQESCPI